MPLDPNIILGGQQMPDAVNSLLRVTQTVEALKGMQRQHQARDIVAGAMGSGQFNLNNINALMQRAGPAAPEVAQLVQPMVEQQQRQQQAAMQAQRMLFEQQRIAEQQRRTDIMLQRMAQQQQTEQGHVPSQESLKQAVDAELLTKRRPLVGFGKSGEAARQAYNEAFGQRLNELGWDATDLANARARYAGLSRSMVLANESKNAVGQYVGAVLPQMDRAEALSKKIAGPFKLMNVAQLAVRAQFDPTVAEYLTQIEPIIRESARIVEQPRLVGQLSVQSQEHMRNVINRNYTPAQLNAAFKALKFDFEARDKALQKQIGSISGEIKGLLKPKTEADSAAEAPPADTATDAILKKYGVTP